MRKSLAGIVFLSFAGMIISLRLAAEWLSLESGSAPPFCLSVGELPRSCVEYLWSAGSLPFDIPVMLPVSVLFLWLMILSLWKLCSSFESAVFEKAVPVSALILTIVAGCAVTAMFASHAVCGIVIAICVIAAAATILAVARYARVRRAIADNAESCPRTERFVIAAISLCAIFLLCASGSLYYGIRTRGDLLSARESLLRERVRSLVISPKGVRGFPRSIIGRGGGKDAKVVFAVFSDPFCPACLSFYEKEDAIIARYGKAVRFDHYLLPLDKECNGAVKGAGHRYSCEVSRLEYAAARTGLLDAFLKNHTKRLTEIKKLLSNNAMREKIAATYTGRSSNGDFLKITAGVDCTAYIRRDLDFARQNGISRTPTVFVQGRRMAPPVTEEFLSAAIDGFLNSP